VRYFVEEIFPLVRAREPRAEFFIVGSKPTDEVTTLGLRDGVTVTGFVEDVRPYLHSATVCVMPLRIARGVQNKALEAMAAGKAVVATPETVAGLRVVNDEHLLVAGDPRSFAEAVVEVIRDEGLRLRLGNRARVFVEAEHDWKPALQKLTQLVETVGARDARSERSNVRAIANR
jgi:glycosyltransferase involved in cell wall biosynthesis